MFRHTLHAKIVLLQSMQQHCRLICTEVCLPTLPLLLCSPPSHAYAHTLHFAGDERPGRIAADMVFIIDEKPHALFKRDGDNLVIHRRISLSDALCGVEFQVPTLDGRVLNISTKDEVVTPNHSKIIR